MPKNPKNIANHLLILTTSPRIKIESRVENTGERNVSETTVASGNNERDKYTKNRATVPLAGSCKMQAWFFCMKPISPSFFWKKK